MISPCPVCNRATKEQHIDGFQTLKTSVPAVYMHVVDFSVPVPGREKPQRMKNIFTVTIGRLSQLFRRPSTLQKPRLGTSWLTLLFGTCGVAKLTSPWKSSDSTNYGVAESDIPRKYIGCSLPQCSDRDGIQRWLSEVNPPSPVMEEKFVRAIMKMESR